MIARWIVQYIVFYVVLSYLPVAAAGQPLPVADDDSWSASLVAPGVWDIPTASSDIFAVTDYGGNLVAGGVLNHAGDTAVINLCQWDGTTWIPMAWEINGTVRTLLVHGGDLIVGGFFTRLDGVVTNCIARWDGVAWHAMGNGMNGGIMALTVYNNEVVAGGWYTNADGKVANGVARWDGSEWHPFAAGVDLRVSAVVEYNGRLIAGGNVHTQGGASVNYVGEWNGSSWSTVGAGVDGAVGALAAQGGELFAGGSFANAGGAPAQHVASWNGNTWSALGAGVDDRVHAMTVYGGQVVAAGEFTIAGGDTVNRVAVWNGGAWVGLGAGIRGDAAERNSVQQEAVWALTPYGGGLVAAGTFAIAGDVVANRVAWWVGGAWNAIGGADGMGDRVLAFEEYDGEVVAGGSFRAAGATPAERIAAWDGVKWSALGTGVSDGGACAQCFPYVSALSTYGGDLVAGGNFRQAGGQPANYIARWDGGAWHSLSSGLSGINEFTTAGQPPVAALATYDNELIVAGKFAGAGAGAANNIARWNGGAWSAFGTGADDAVDALTVYGGELVAAGDFAMIDGVSANRIAKWDGMAWQPLGDGMNNTVSALVEYDGDLIAGGSFTSAGGVTALGIARWSGTSWAAFGSGASGAIFDFAVIQGHLIAGGLFTQIDGVSASRIARWDSTSWNPLGSGVNGRVEALRVDQDSLFVGGEFTMAGAKFSTYIAKWTEADSLVPVFIQDFTGTAVMSGVRLNWDILADDETKGYNVYCGKADQEVPTRINLGGLIAPDRNTYLHEDARRGEAYRYTLGVVLADDSEIMSQTITVTAFPLEMALDQNQPNPFNPTTTVRFTVGETGRVTLRIYDVSGRRIRTLVDGLLAAGPHSTRWDGRSDSGAPVASGIYFYRLTSGTQQLTRKAVLLK